MSVDLAALEALGALSALDVELARTLARLAGETRPELALSVALASREVQAGHVCADLEKLADQPLGAEDAGGPRCPKLAPWLDALANSPLVSTHGLDAPARPLVLEGPRLYLARYYEHELAVAAQLCRLAAPTDSPLGASTALVDRLFPPRASGTDLQRKAALTARERRFSVIVGGPGTGKTSTVVKLLALLASDALASSSPLPRTLLVAPTGKAALRLSEAIARARDGLPVEDAIKQHIETRASTLHRALGPREGSLTRFRHGPERPLECDLVLLDEASMVDLALMRRFLDAVPTGARVILLGDPDQLASVEAGGVLHDICRAAEAGSGPLAGCVTRLLESYRYPADSGIGRLARAVHAQAVDDVLALAHGGLEGVTRSVPPSGAHALGRALTREVRERYRGLRAHDLELRLATLDTFRVLCAHRKGPGSVEQLNPAIARALGQRSERARASYAGRPIMITQNDYATELFNGDVGVLHEEAPRRRELAACFRSDKNVRRIALGRLPAHESAYAMTVHKSQGSEFDHVAIVLPERPSRILSRELLYTAITRAKHGISLYATDAALRAAVLARVERSSGLAARLAQS